ncbi:mediator complex subunit [Ascosphaera pollenicola]|nr:mediator complex subunit [Ascosphaera pollenicola]
MPGITMNQNNSIRPDPAAVTISNRNSPSAHAHLVASEKSQSSPKEQQADHRLATSIELLQKKPSLVVSSPPPEVPHLSEFLHPFAKLLNRAAQQCWNDLNELFTALAEIPPGKTTPNGSAPAQSSSSSPVVGDPAKRLRILQFAQDKRNSFIKLLVLSQWSYRAIDVTKLIDLHAWALSQYAAYNFTCDMLGQMKSDLDRAQLRGPDFETAVRLFSVDATQIAKATGLLPRKPLTPSQMLRTLRDLNKKLKKRLVLQEEIPEPLSNYVIRDGRVTFIVENTFELDLFIVNEDDPQLFFLDLRLAFSPSAILPEDKVLRNLEFPINHEIYNHGLRGCFDYVNGIVLSMKIAILYQQARQLSFSIWSGNITVQLIHRTLVVQYWRDKPGPKSWIQVAIRRRTAKSDVAALTLRWVCDGSDRDTSAISFDQAQLSAPAIVKSVIASHSSLILGAIYRGVCEMPLFSTGVLYVGLHTSHTEPGDCCLTVQLTRKRTVRVFVEPSRGTTMLHVSPPLVSAAEGSRPRFLPPGAIINRIAFLRCVAVHEELQPILQGLRLERLHLSTSCREDLGRRLPPTTIRIDVFRHESLSDDWGIVLANGRDGDSWYIIQLEVSDFVAADGLLGGAPVHTKKQTIKALHLVTSNLLTPENDLSYSLLATLRLACLGMVVLHTNIVSIEQLPGVFYTPPLTTLRLEPLLRVPPISLCYRPSTLPQHLQVKFPSSRQAKALLRDTVQVSFKRYDSHSKRAIMMVHGRLRKPLPQLNELTKLLNHKELSFSSNGEDFFLPFVCPVGVPIMDRVLLRLQRLEHVLRILKIVSRKGVEVKSISLSRIEFVSPSGDLVRLCVRVKQSKDSAPSTAGGTQVSAPPADLEMSIRFPRLNFKQEIKDSLVWRLTQHDLEIGFDLTLQLLSSIQPLLETLSSLAIHDPSSSASDDTPLNIEVIPRDAKLYHIHYPNTGHTFSLQLSYQNTNMMWILRDLTPTQRQQQWAKLQEELNNAVFRQRCTEWTGLRNGAVADTTNVSALVKAIHSVLQTYGPKVAPPSSAAPSASASATAGVQSNTSTSGGTTSTGGRGPPGPGTTGTGTATATTATATHASASTASTAMRQPPNQPRNDADVIMIDD